jgi:hypothetical protein
MLFQKLRNNGQPTRAGICNRCKKPLVTIPYLSLFYEKTAARANSGSRLIFSFSFLSSHFVSYFLQI